MAETYRTFKRSCSNWQGFARARKITVSRGLTFSEAYDDCEKFNDNRTAAQIKKGLKMEFELER